jgi:glycosyltransferase involved in cell wall biosynthesis
LNVLILTRYSHLGASSRLRSLQYLPWFEQAGLTYTLSPLIEDEALQQFYQKGRYQFADLLHAYWRRIRILLQRYDFDDLIWMEKEALPWLPAWLERKLLGGVPYVLDYDDAIFHNYDKHSSPWVRYCLGQRIDKLMAGATLVIAGNAYLAQRARNAGAQQIAIIPTVIDLERYTPKPDITQDDDKIRIVWIGSPHTLKYLQRLHKPLAILSQRFTFNLRIINSISLELPGIDVEFVPWTEAGEVAALQACDIGIMPLVDSPWERGKCGYKLIQYMACGLPVVASPVGVNTEIVRIDENGYLAKTDDEWVDVLGKLLGSRTLRQQMGKAGRKLVEKEYCIQQVAPKLIKLLHETKAAN